jgi:hypothetical protein
MNPNLDVNDFLRRFNRDTAWVFAWLLGGLICAALAVEVLIPELHPRMTGLQAESAPSPAANAAELVKDSNARRSANQVPSGTLTLVDQESTESSSKESHAQAEAAAASTPTLGLILPEPSPSIATANVNNWSLAQKKSAQASRGKAPYRRGKSSGALRDIDVKKRLIELWHQSLVRTAGDILSLRTIEPPR